MAAGPTHSVYDLLYWLRESLCNDEVSILIRVQIPSNSSLKTDETNGKMKKTALPAETWPIGL